MTDPNDKPDENAPGEPTTSEATGGGESAERKVEAEHEKSALPASELVDSEAWLDYYAAHAKAVPFIKQHIARPPQAFATSEQLAHLYATLFHARYVNRGGASFHQTLKELQARLRNEFRPGDLGDRGEKINAFLQQFYAMELQDSKPPTKEITLSREQVIELWHIFVTQSDVKILSPWSDTGDGTKPW